MPALDKYLDRYAEPESQQLAGFPSGFADGLVVPMYKEALFALDRFVDYLDQHDDLLIIIVINRPTTDTDTGWASKLLNHPFLLQHPSGWQTPDQVLCLHTAGKGGLLVVDRCIKGSPIATDQGVGLARKIGADILCQLIHQGKVLSPWISNTDADAILPHNYFQHTSHLQLNQAENKPTAARVFPFQHIFIDETPRLPTMLYEFSLHYYVAGLQWAGSPYAYHTIGSTLCVDYLHYARVRGFPKRSGAEDFYLLNKLAKTGRIESLTSPTIDLQARESTRAPFGTGQAVISLAEQQDLLSMPLYHPSCFLYLKFFLELIAQLTARKSNMLIVAGALADSSYNSIDIRLIDAIADKFQLQNALDHCFKHGKTEQTRLQQMTHWFDGFKTLKFIHYLRDHTLSSIEFRDWPKHCDEQHAPYNHTLAVLAAQIAAISSKGRSLPSDNSLT